MIRQLDATAEASGPHVFAVRINAVRQRRIRVHRIPFRVRDDREPPPWKERDGNGYTSDLAVLKIRIFFAEGLDRILQIVLSGKSGPIPGTKPRLGTWDSGARGISRWLQKPDRSFLS
jgi:hypothetical protein